MSKFDNVSLFINGNSNLREPQIEAYNRIRRYFISSDRKEGLVVLPTGTGKTGVIAIAPYAVSKKRTLVITPQTVIANTIMGSLDSSDHKNFWYFSEVINDINDLPTVVHYHKKITKGTLEKADLVIVNIHKLQERLESALLKKVDEDFFDFIIIDEAHHSEAYTWKNAINYFKNAHVLKLTGTPFRSDGAKITGDEIFKYPLSKAMAYGYVKSLEKFYYAPEQMFFTIDGKEKTYTLNELKNLKIKDNDWISRKVALSVESNKGVIKRSIELLRKKKAISNNPHKIVAVACSIEHAEQLQKLYEAEGLKTALVHSLMEKSDLAQSFSDIDNHKVEVVINVALLGEGYDHKFLSIAAIFRPFKSDLPYQQFVGRVLRSITPEASSSIAPEDNIAQIVAHRELGLEPLWAAYKKEIIKSGMIKEVRKEKRETTVITNTQTDNVDISESNNHILIGDTFINTELLKEREKNEKEEQDKISSIMETLGISKEEAKKIIESTKTNKTKAALLRPDLLQENLRKEIDDRVREEIVPELLANNNLELKGNELYNKRSLIFPFPMLNFLSKYKENGAILSIYFNTELKNKIGAAREEWEIEDYYTASDTLDKILPFISAKIQNCFRR